VTKKQLHLIRHGEVFNPEGILYGRLPGYGLSERGERMAEQAADALASRGRKVSAVYASPLLRAQQSAAPVARHFDVPVHNEPRIIEPTNKFEGKHPRSSFAKPHNWWLFWNPLLPSWGEPYMRIRRRVQAAMEDAWDAHGGDEEGDGDIVFVTHQAPIWNAHLSVAKKPLAHNPGTRRCALSSITSFTKQDGRWVEVGYESPAETQDVIDVGAV
jgi:broad specificity phosphatase PhoE